MVSESISVESAIRMVSWPNDQLDQLRPVAGNTGLFEGPDGNTYAHLGDEGHFLVQQSSDGNYQVPLPFAPDLPGPILKKIEGQPLWRIEPPNWLPRESGPQTEAINKPARPTSPTFIPAHLAVRLTPAANSPDGIRYDNRTRTYVDMQEGTVMVHIKPDGSYQQTSANESIPSGHLLERIPETNLWQKLEPTATTTQTRRRPNSGEPDRVAGPSKRPRLDEDHSSSPDTDPFAENILANEPQVLDFSSKLWRNWGKATKPDSGQTVEIAGLHYPIVSQIVHSGTRVVYLKHPRFKPERFDGFEQMLLDDPSLQPRWAAKRQGQWSVIESRFPFEKPLTQYVADSVGYLSEQSSRAVAKAMFRDARDTEVINGEGLLILSQTFRHWGDRALHLTPRRSLADPLMMLPEQPIMRDGTTGGRIVLPSPSAQHLQRLDFDPQKFPQEWSEYAAAPGDASLRKLFKIVLEKNAYTVSPLDYSLVENALVFHREGLDAVFVLKLPHVSADFIPRFTRPGSEMTSSVSQMRLDEVGRQRLNALLAQDKLIYLVGGTQQLSPEKQTLFILREG
ncbi:hypothetical protein [Pseudomonas sp. LB3P14]